MDTGPSWLSENDAPVLPEERGAVLEEARRQGVRGPGIVVVGAGVGERAERFAAAAMAAGFARPQLFSWAELLRNEERFETALEAAPPTLLRLDGHDGNFDCWLALVEAGAGALAASGAEPVAVGELEQLREERSLTWRRDIRLMHHQAYLGLNVLALQAAKAARARGAILLNDPEAIAVCGDRMRCHTVMRNMGLSVPDLLGVREASADSLLEAMKQEKCPRVFVKSRFGSAASVVAVAVSAHGVTAWAGAEVATRKGRRAVYASRQVRKFTESGDVAALTEAVLTAGGQVEVWIPKAGHEGTTVDLRLLTIAGEPRHVVLRQANSPITNLRLGARHGDAAAFLGRLRRGVWDAVCAQAQSFAQRFPHTLQLAFDVAIPLRLNRHYFLEASCFGGSLCRRSHDGSDPYATLFAALPGWIMSQS
ncbi:MAG: STM4014 family protein [Alphaproteobacteria bacterium]|nr:STM4014 family protein [Alphaproteobacteria bacterium]